MSPGLGESHRHAADRRKGPAALARAVRCLAVTLAAAGWSQAAAGSGTVGTITGTWLNGPWPVLDGTKAPGPVLDGGKAPVESGPPSESGVSPRPATPQSAAPQSVPSPSGEAATSPEVAVARSRVTLRAHLAREHPRNAALQRGLAEAQRDLAEALADADELDAALEALRPALRMFGELAARYPDDPAYQLQVLACHVQIGRILRDQGDIDAAMDAAGEISAIVKRAAGQYGADPDWQAALASAYRSVGGVRQAAGDGDGALRAYRAALDFARRLVLTEPERHEHGYQVAMVQVDIGDLLVDRDDAEAGLQAYEDALRIDRDLVRRDPSDSDWQGHLALVHGRIGDARYGLNDLEGALAAFREALTVIQALGAQDRDNPDLLGDEIEYRGRIGYIDLVRGDPEAALAQFEPAVELAERLAALNSNDAESREALEEALRRLALAQERIGEARREGGDAPGALAAFVAALAATERLMVLDPQNDGRQADLVDALSRAGWAARDAGETDRAVILFERLQQVSPNLADPYEALAMIAFDRRDYPLAINHATRVVELWRAAADPRSGSIERESLARSLGNLSFYFLFVGNDVSAERAAREAMSIDPDEVWLQTNLAHALMFQGRTQEADAIYRGNVGRAIRGGRDWTEVILEDLQLLRNAGRTHPHIMAVEAALAPPPRELDPAPNPPEEAPQAPQRPQ